MTTADTSRDSSLPRLTRGVSLAIGVAIFLTIVVATTGNFCVDVLLQGTADGFWLAFWLLAGFGYGRQVLRGVGEVPAGLRVVTEITLGLGILGLIEALLGFAGLLGSPAITGMLVGGASMGLRQWRHRSFQDLRPWLAERSMMATIAWLWAVPVAIGFVAASMAPGFLWKPLDPHPYDVLSYHLQIPREWYDAGRIIPLRHNSFSFFPMGMETHFLTAMHLRGGPWAGMYLCQFVSLAHGVLAALGVTAVCRSMKVGPVGSTLAGVATLAVPWTLMLSSVCYVESGVMLYTLLAVAWAMRALTVDAERPDAADRFVDENIPTKESAAYAAASGADSFRRVAREFARCIGAMTLAGAFAGFACGMKYTAVAMTAAPLLVLWPIFAWRTLDRKRLVLAWLAGAVACGLVFSPWLIRNAVTTGNPVFPLATGVFGRGHFTPEQVDRYQIAHSPPPAEQSVPARLNAALRGVVTDGQFGYVLIPAVLGAAGLAVLRRHRPGHFLLLVLVAMAGVWLFATHLLPRFLSPAIPVAVVFVAVTFAGLPRVGEWIGLAVSAALAVCGLCFTSFSLRPALAMGREGLFRMPDMTAIETDEAKAVRTSGQKIVLVGDAQAFLWCVPSDRLIYRGVFDAVVPPDVDLIDGWTGRAVDEWRRDGCWVVINLPELDRLSGTYAHLPKSAVPSLRNWRASNPSQIVLPPLP